MASTIDRTDITVDDDSGTPGAPVGDGTSIDNTWLQILLDEIDALFSGALSIGGAFTAVSAAFSGAVTAASLTLSGALSAATGAFSGAVTMATTLAVTGFASFTVGIKERGRSVAMGEEIAVTFNAGNFTSSGPSFVYFFDVASGDIATNSYTLIGKQVFWSCRIANASIASTANDTNTLLFTIPGGFTAAIPTLIRVGYAVVAGTVVDCYALATGTTVSVVRLDGGTFPNNTNQTVVYFDVRIPIA